MSKILSLVGQRLVAINRLHARPNLIFKLESSNYSCLLAQKGTKDNQLCNSTQPTILASLPSCRHLYSAESLRLDSLEAHQRNISQFYQTDKESYIERIRKYVDQNDSSSILLQDLINVIGLAESVEDLDLIESIARAIKTNNQFSIKTWGSAVMRLYYKMNELERAYTNLKDDQLYGDFFNSFTCYRIGMVMFYNNKRYDEVLDIYNLAISRLAIDSSYKTDGRLCSITIVALAALAHQNKPDTLITAEKIFGSIDLDEIGRFLRTRIVSLMAYIAYNIDQPSLALNIISESKSQNYITLRELKTLSLLKLERYEDVIFHIRANLLNAVGREKKAAIPKDVFTLIKEKAQGLDGEIGNNLMDTLNELEKSGLVQDEKLVTLIFSEINPPLRRNPDDLDSMPRQEHRDNRGARGNRQNRRYRATSEEPFSNSI